MKFTRTVATAFRITACAIALSALSIAPKALSQQAPPNWDLFVRGENGDEYYLDTDSFISPVAGRAFPFVVIKVNGTIDNGVTGAIIDLTGSCAASGNQVRIDSIAMIYQGGRVSPPGEIGGNLARPARGSVNEMAIARACQY